jgi:putative transposase
MRASVLIFDNYINIFYSVSMINRAYKYRVYPNKVQQELLEKHFGCVRFCFNWGLDKKIKAYQQDKKRLSCFDLINELAKLKKKKNLNG